MVVGALPEMLEGLDLDLGFEERKEEGDERALGMKLSWPLFSLVHLSLIYMPLTFFISKMIFR